jgi:hypothetical protein
MRINGAPGGQTSLGLNFTNANRPGSADGIGGDASAAYAAFVPGQAQTKSDFQPLVDTLDRIPLIRQEVVGEVAKLLNGGDLDTPQARQQTVESILGASPGHD